MPLRPKPPEAPVIDMTIDGRIVEPASTWERMRTASARIRAIWRILPRGTLPALATALLVLAAAAVLFVGVLIVVLPVIAGAVLLALVFGLARPSRSLPPARR